MAGLVTDDAGNVAASGSVLGEHHIARAESAYRAVAGFDLNLSRERDDVLPSRHRVIIVPIRWRSGAEHDSMCGMQCGSFDSAAKVKFNFDVFEMGLIIGTRVKSDDLHEAVCRRIGREMQVLEKLT